MLDSLCSSCSSSVHPVRPVARPVARPTASPVARPVARPPFPLRNAFLGHYIGPIEEGEEMQRSSQTESCAGSSVI